jgi:hypothetical protein
VPQATTNRNAELEASCGARQHYFRLEDEGGPMIAMFVAGSFHGHHQGCFEPKHPFARPLEPMRYDALAF